MSVEKADFPNKNNTKNRHIAHNLLSQMVFPLVTPR